MVGQVKVAIDISKRRVIFRGNAQEAMTRIVNINAKRDKKLSLESLSFSLSERISYSIKELVPGKSFQIQLNTLPGPPGKFNGKLRLKTNYPEHPEIIIQIRCYLASAQK